MKHGCKMEISLRGMLKAIFSPHNRLVCVEMIYDVMSYMQQLRRAAGKRDFAVSLCVFLQSQEHLFNSETML